MHHKTLERLFMFAEVARSLSFSKAAKALGISKGHLSAQVKVLEQELDVPLLLRTTRTVRLTLEGEKVLATSQRIKLMTGELERGLNTLDGNIRLTAPKLFAQTYLVDVMRQFRSIHPTVKFELNTSYTPHDLNYVNFDMAFRATDSSPPENMVSKKLLDYTQVVVASPDYLQKHGTPLDLESLHEHNCLSAHESTVWSFDNANIKVNCAISSNDNIVLKELALKSEGIVRLPSYFLDSEIKQGTLVPLLTNQAAKRSSLYLLYPTATRESSRLSAFTSFVSDYFKSNLG